MDFTFDDDDDSVSNAKYSAMLPGNVPLGTKYKDYSTSRLTPGSTLLECNGSDIHLGRGAAAVPTTNTIAPPPKQQGKSSKTKHRYLIVWPGMLSLNPKRKSATNDGEDPKLGKLEGLDTDHPTLKIPFGGGKEGHLAFVGRKVPSSSKFMMLNCSKKGSVVVKVSKG